MEKYTEYFRSLNVAYVDDELINTDSINTLFNYFFNSIKIFNNPKEFINNFTNYNFDIIFLDICMPEIIGIELVKLIRKNDKLTPLILLTAHSKEEYLLESANLNIQSYIIKPISSKKLTVAFKNIYEYMELTNNISHKINGFEFDSENFVLVKNEKIVKLTKKERDLLKLLIINCNHLVPYEQIELSVWTDNDESMSQNALRTVVKTLKKKLEDNSLIENISGLGYIIHY